MAQSFSAIQNHIFSRLKNAKILRYSELQLADVPNDLFNYHLQFLVKKGYVERSEVGYALSPLGIRHIADFNPPLGEHGSAHLFKVNVLTVVSRLNKGKIEVLNQVRKSNPSYGKVGVMGGVVYKGESTSVAATRKLKEETGLDAMFKIVGIERRTMYLKGELFSDVMFPIAYSDASSGELIEDAGYGKNLWVDIDTAIENESAEFDSIVALKYVLEAIRDKKIKKLPFFYTEDIQSGELI